MESLFSEFEDGPVLIRRVRDPFGRLGNMSPDSVLHEGQLWPTAEALFQALRFNDPEIREKIRVIKNPMKCKIFSKSLVSEMSIPLLSEKDLDNMRLVLRLKHEQHKSIQSLLAETRDRQIIEDCSNRRGGSGLFWGAAKLLNDEWGGQNWLGVLWMEIRDVSAVKA